MPTSPPRGCVARLRDLLAEAFDRPAWHGPNLRGLLRGVSARDAAFRLHPDRHNIQELVVHCAYWKYTVVRRLRGEKRGSFPLGGSNWFARDGAGGETAWRADRALLDEQHAQLLAAVAGLTDADLERKPPGSRHTVARLVTGAAAHDLYHAGQVAMLKRSVAPSGARRRPTRAARPS
jgi:hypothetical protein